MVHIFGGIILDSKRLVGGKVKLDFRESVNKQSADDVYNDHSRNKNRGDRHRNNSVLCLARLQKRSDPALFAFGLVCFFLFQLAHLLSSSGVFRARAP